MYCPEVFAETRSEILRARNQRYPLATLVSMGANGPEAYHILLYLAPGE
ncbi:FMN-binding negative transcriptional regulator [Acidithiobacillus ferrivorans]|nr:FMN-binding negative transcriptional regulator [Acidithiobacillus ferrivorans]